MAGIYDGSDYMGMDSEGIGTGANDENTHPLSTYKENRLDGNTRWLRERGQLLTYNWPESSNVDTAGKRLSYSDKETGKPPSMVTLPLLVQPGPDTIRAQVYCVIDSRGAGSNYELRLSVLDPRTGAEAETLTGGTGAGTPEVVEVSLDVSGVDIQGPLLEVRLAFVSNSEDRQGDSDIDVETSQFINVTSGNASNPNNDEAELGDAFYLISHGGSGLATIYNVTPPDGNNDAWSHISWENDLGGNPNATPIRLTYIQPYSASIEVSYDSDTDGRRWRSKNAEEMGAQRPVANVDSQATNLDAVAARANPLAVGPCGQEWDTIYEPSAYFPTYWNWHGPDLEQAEQNVLDDQNVRIRDDRGELTVSAYLSAWREGRYTFDNTSGNNPTPPYALDSDTFAKYTSVEDIDIRIRLLQLADGDNNWSAANVVADVTETIRGVQVYPAYATNAHLPTQVFAAMFPKNRRHRTGFDDPAAPLKDGLLWPSDRQFLEPLTISLSPFGVDTSKPVRVVMDAPNLPTGQLLICHQTVWYEDRDV